MPNLTGKTASALLFAILTTGCASQNAMSLIPSAVKLDIAREKAVKDGPLSVDDMLAKSRSTKAGSALPPEKPQALTQIDNGVTGSEHAAIAADLRSPEPIDQSSKQANNVLAVEYAELAGNSADRDVPRANRSPAELFDEAQALLADRHIAKGQYGNTQISGVDTRDAADNEEWRSMLADGDVTSETSGDESAAAISDSTMTTAALPQKAESSDEIIGVAFDAAGASLVKDDDLKLRLLRYGKRAPSQIVIGKVEGLAGFEAMQKALSMAKLVSDACGGNPGVSYDPALPPGAAELYYPSLSSAS